jgi:predicted RNA binding protein YcfA (HicA-like mRNA interferase family)
MPAKAKELMRAAEKIGFVRARQKGSHARWQHPDGRD